MRAQLGSRAVRVIDAAVDGGTNVLRALDAWPGERFVYLTFKQSPQEIGKLIEDLMMEQPN